MRKFGQHFLASRETAQKIVAACDLKADDEVLEIGPGHGELSEHYIGKVSQTYLVEIDPKLHARLNQKWGDRADVKILLADFRNFAIDSLVFQNDPIIVSNLPYYASKPILAKILAWSKYKRAVLMMQKELIERILAQPGDSSRGALSLFFQMKATGETVLELGREAFRPPPKVKSAVIKIEPKASPYSEQDQAKIENLIRLAFRHRRKTLINNLAALNMPKNILGSALENLQVPLKARAQDISLTTYAALARMLI